MQGGRQKTNLFKRTGDGDLRSQPHTTTDLIRLLPFWKCVSFFKNAFQHVTHICDQGVDFQV